jgi:hypothetical protein
MKKENKKVYPSFAIKFNFIIFYIHLIGFIKALFDDYYNLFEKLGYFFLALIIIGCIFLLYTDDVSNKEQEQIKYLKYKVKKMTKEDYEKKEVSEVNIKKYR